MPQVVEAEALLLGRKRGRDALFQVALRGAPELAAVDEAVPHRAATLHREHERLPTDPAG
jgi:hypothetical protein